MMDLQQDTPYYDYRFKFLRTSLPLALNALQSLVTAGITSGLPENMLGEPRGIDGKVCSLQEAVWKGSPGRDAFSYLDETETEIQVPAAGDSEYFYVAIRSTTEPSSIPFDPTQYGLIQISEEESEAVLGSWA